MSEILGHAPLLLTLLMGNNNNNAKAQAAAGTTVIHEIVAEADHFPGKLKVGNLYCSPRKPKVISQPSMHQCCLWNDQKSKIGAHFHARNVVILQQLLDAVCFPIVSFFISTTYLIFSKTTILH